MDENEVDDAIQHNYEHFMRHGPGLSSAYKTFIVAKDSVNKLVLVGGLGGMGVGEMVFEMTEKHEEYPGWAEAEERHLETHRWDNRQ